MKELIRIEKQDLLILDDFGILPMDQQSSTMLMEDRHGKRFTIITSQLPVKLWYEVIGEKRIETQNKNWITLLNKKFEKLPDLYKK